MAKAAFHWLDIVVFALTLLVSLGIGLYFGFTGDRQRSTQEYLTGNRRLRLLPVAMSMFMSYVSAIYVLGNNAEMYNYGVQLWLSNFGGFIGFFICVVFFVPLFYNLQVTSAFEYLDLRFRSNALRVTAVLILLINQVVYMGLAMFAPATALEAVTGFPVWASIITAGFVTMFYTVIGGMKAVVWTDVFQGLVLFGGVIAVLIAATLKVGGISEVWAIAHKGGRLNFFDFNPDPTVRASFWPLIVGRAFYAISWMGVAQTQVQRYCSLPTLRAAQLSVLANIPFLLVISVVSSLAGLAVYAYYTQQGCDPLRAGYISSSNQLLPYFIVNVLNYPGLPGLFLAVLFSGALSSLSSSMNSLSAVTWKDFLEPKFHHLPEARQALITKILVFIYGVLAMLMAAAASFLSGHIFAASTRLIGGIVGPLGGIFILGGVFPRANWKGAVVGSVAAIGFTGWINIGAYIYSPHQATLPTVVTNCSLAANATVAPVPTDPTGVFPLYRLSFLWIAVIGSLTTVAVGLLVSLITGLEKSSDQDPRTIIPVCERVHEYCIPDCFCGRRRKMSLPSIDEKNDMTKSTVAIITEDYTKEKGIDNNIKSSAL